VSLMSKEKGYQKLLFILNETNPYIILGVEENADQEKINKVYRELAKSYHPDVFQYLQGSAEHKEIENLFQKITHAYNILKDPKERKKFDAQLNWNRGNDTEEKTTSPLTPPQQDFFFGQAASAQKKGDDSRREREKKLFEEAKDFILSKNFDEAIKILKSLLERNSKDAQLHSYLGLAMMGKGWDGYAQAEFKVALHFDPGDQVALKNYKGAAANSKTTKPVETEEKKAGFFGKLFGRKKD
jgi:curved DNA-binding protein CbpA